MPWIAVHTPTRGEDAAAAWLAGQGVDTYCPTARSFKRRKVRGQNRYRIETPVEPVFPRYFFAEAIPEAFDSLREAPESVGRLKVVSAGDQPLIMRDDVLDKVKATFSPDGPPRPLDGMAIGSRVRVSCLGDVEISSLSRLERHREVTVLANILGRREVNVSVERVIALT